MSFNWTVYDTDGVLRGACNRKYSEGLQPRVIRPIPTRQRFWELTVVARLSPPYDQFSDSLGSGSRRPPKAYR